MRSNGCAPERELPEEVDTKRVVKPYDAAAKQLLACRPILAFVLKNTIEELADCTVEEIANELIDGEVRTSDTPVHVRGVRSPLAVGMRNEDDSLDEGTIFYDMLLRVKLPDGDGSLGVIVNLEPHSYETDYPVLKRALYYCARLLSAQRGWGRAGSDYGALEKVYSVWLLTGSQSAGEGGITTYAFEEKKLCGNFGHERLDYDLAEVVFVHLPQAGGYNGFLEKLATLFSLETGRDEKLRALEGELTWDPDEAEELVGRLMSMGEYAVEYGIEKGFAQGVQQGIEEGIEQGRVQGQALGYEAAMLESVRALMASMGWDADQAMDALGLDVDARGRYRGLLEE